MSTKKYLSLTGLTEYDGLLKDKMAKDDASTLASAKTYADGLVAGKSDTGHNHDDRYYTESEIDSKLSNINSSITNITSGTVIVKEAEHATNAEHATSADSATTAASADSATKATQDGNGKVISSTYETKTDANSKLEEAKSYTDTVASGKSDTTHKHDNDYDVKGAANNALTEAKSYTDTKTSGMATTTVVDNKISSHNTSSTAHNDIRDLISTLSTKVNNFLDVDDTTTDQLSEVLTLINNNKGTLESLTSSKVNVSDIVDNLTTASASKVLSANQGVALKALIDALDAEVDGKADTGHGHTISDVSGLQTALDGKANSEHGTHVTWSTTTPKANGTAAVGTETKVARGDHVHPTDTTRAAKSDLDALTTTVSGKADTGHKHAISDVTNLQSSLDAKQATITGGATSIVSSNLTTSRALISDANGKVAVSAVTSTELGYLDGVTSAIQSQLDGKSATGHGHDAATTSAAGFMTAAMVTKLNGIAEGANKTVVDTALSSSSTNPVQNKVVNSAISTLTSTVTTNTSSISANTTAISALQTAFDEIETITSAEIEDLFK